MQPMIFDVRYEMQPRTIVAEAFLDGKFVCSANGSTYGDAEIALRGALSHTAMCAGREVKLRG